MRKIFRSKNNLQYWEDRWNSSGTDDLQGFQNEEIYPIYYVRDFIGKNRKILEMGCGAGRLYFHFSSRGEDIQGFDFSAESIKAIKKVAPDAAVKKADIRKLPYRNETFDVLFSFGLYHNFEFLDDIKKAISESARVLKSGGDLIFSVRHDSIENRLIEHTVGRRLKRRGFNLNEFHRCHFDEGDLRNFFEPHFELTSLNYVRNVSWLFKFSFFRKQNLKNSSFDERNARSNGFELNLFGKLVDTILHTFFKRHFSNLIVVSAKKKR